MREIDVNQLLVVTQGIHALAADIEKLSAEAPKYTPQDLGYLLNKISDNLKYLSSLVHDLEDLFI